MLEGHDLVYFSPGQWDGLWRNRHQLMSIFGRKNRVLWVERRPHRRVSQQGEQPQRLLGSVRHISDHLYVFSYPAWAPVSGRTPLKELTRAVRRMAIGKALQTVQMVPPVPDALSGGSGRSESDVASGSKASSPKVPFGRPIVWFSHPSMVDLIAELPSRMLRRTKRSDPGAVWLYHVVDEYTAYSGVTPQRRQAMEEREKELMSRVDAVIVVSKALYEAKRPYNEHTYLVPNGVNYAAYSEALADEHLPRELEGIPTPRLGYSGLIGDRLNMGMLSQLAEEHPEWSLVFLGEARVVQQAGEWEAMLRLPNVHYVGQVDVSRVPHFLKGFQVGLMPYTMGLESENISPLKLYDYLAAGLPVASVDIPAAREFRQQVHLASRHDEFAQAAAAALADTAPARCQERRAIAAQHTWEARVEQLSQIIRRVEA